MNILKAVFNRIFRRREYQALLHELNYKDGQVNAVMEFPGIGILADEIGSLFDKAGGVNFVEFTVLNVARMRTFVVTIRLKTGKTQGQVIDELKAEIEQLKAVQSEH